MNNLLTIMPTSHKNGDRFVSGVRKGKDDKKESRPLTSARLIPYAPSSLHRQVGHPDFHVTKA